jgi:hypothetical protein
MLFLTQAALSARRDFTALLNNGQTSYRSWHFIQFCTPPTHTATCTPSYFPTPTLSLQPPTGCQPFSPLLYLRFRLCLTCCKSLQYVKLEEGDGKGMWHVWGKGVVHTGFWWGNSTESDHSEDQEVYRRIILKWICKK